MAVRMKSGSDLTFDIVTYAALTAVFIVIAYPLIYVVSASFSSTHAVVSGRVWLWPVEPGLQGYLAVFRHPLLLVSFRNSVLYVIGGTAINLVLTLLAAYPLSRSDLPGRTVFMGLFVFTMFFSGGLIPTYLLVVELGMLNSPLALWLPFGVNIWNMIITRTYFRTTIPTELLESAQLDGCGDFRFFRSVVLPLAGPIVAVMFLFYAVGHWNSFFPAMIYLRDKRLWPLQLVLREILILSQLDPEMVTDTESQAFMAGMADLLKYSLIVIAMAPMMAIYPFVQKYFVKGIMIGALKG